MKDIKIKIVWYKRITEPFKELIRFTNQKEYHKTTLYDISLTNTPYIETSNFKPPNEEFFR